MHLKQTLQENYTVTTEWDGQRYIGITLDWDYKWRQVHLSMPRYVAKALKLFQHKLKKTTTSAVPKCEDHLWRKEIVRHQKIDGAAFRWVWKEIHPKGMWNIFIFRTRRRQHDPLSNLGNCITVRHSYRGYNLPNKSTSRLRCHARRSRAHVSRKQHETRSTKRC